MLAVFLTIENEDERLLAEELYLTYRQQMYGIAYSILHNKEDAEDAVMDSVYKIVSNINKFTDADGNKTKSLIVIITRNTAINRYHSNRIRAYIPIDESADLLADDEPSAIEQMIEQEAYDALLADIRSLDAIYRDVILLKYLYEYENDAIAELTGVAEATVRVRLMRAKKLLMEKRGGGHGNE